MKGKQHSFGGTFSFVESFLRTVTLLNLCDVEFGIRICCSFRKYRAYIGFNIKEIYYKNYPV